MAVVTLFMSDRDQSKTFTDKKQADQYDKMLELAENVTAWMEQSVKDLSDAQAEAIGMLIAENKDKLALALKGKPDVLLEPAASSIDSSSADDKVTPLAAGQ